MLKLRYLNCLSVAVLFLYLIPNIITPFQILPSASNSISLLVAGYFAWHFHFSFCLALHVLALAQVLAV